MVVGNDDSLQTAFRRAMDKVAALGQDSSNLIDCSAVIPVPPARNTTVQYPTGFGPTDIERSVNSLPHKDPVPALTYGSTPCALVVRWCGFPGASTGLRSHCNDNSLSLYASFMFVVHSCGPSSARCPCCQYICMFSNAIVQSVVEAQRSHAH